MKHLIFIFLFLGALSAHAGDIEKMKPSFRCQSKMIALDNTLYLTLTQDKITGVSRIETLRSWIGGLRRASFDVTQITDNTSSSPLIFEGEGVRLIIDWSANADASYLPGELQSDMGKEVSQSEELTCEILR